MLKKMRILIMAAGALLAMQMGQSIAVYKAEKFTPWNHIAWNVSISHWQFLELNVNFELRDGSHMKITYTNVADRTVLSVGTGVDDIVAIEVSCKFQVYNLGFPSKIGQFKMVTIAEGDFRTDYYTTKLLKEDGTEVSDAWIRIYFTPDGVLESIRFDTYYADIWKL